MTKLSSLPSEILLQIFNDTSNIAIENLSQTCKLFHQIAQTAQPPLCIFQVDAPNHSSWHLIRSLLNKPQSGNYIRKIHVEWHRRRADKPDWPETSEWKWKESEKDGIISTVHDNKLSDANKDAILSGINSEALLPFLLTRTPNLESLDMGTVNGDIIIHDETKPVQMELATRTMINLTQSSRTEEDHSLPPTSAEWYEQEGIDPSDDTYPLESFADQCSETYRDLSYLHQPYNVEGFSCCLWLHLSIKQYRSRLPAFQNLRHCRITQPRAPNSPTVNIASFMLFLLPCLETLYMDHCFSDGFESRIPNDMYEGFCEGKLKNKCIKLLELRRGCFDERDVQVIGTISTALEGVAIESTIQRKMGFEAAMTELRKNSRNLGVGDIWLRDGEGNVSGEGGLDIIPVYEL